MREPPAAPGNRDRETAVSLGLVSRLESALRQEDRAAIVDIARQLVALRAPLGEQWEQVAHIVAANGEKQQWTAETTSPSILRRRGWSQASFAPGDKVKLEGMPSQDGSYLMRITRAFREDGTEIGIPAGTSAIQPNPYIC